MFFAFTKIILIIIYPSIPTHKEKIGKLLYIQGLLFDCLIYSILKFIHLIYRYEFLHIIISLTLKHKYFARHTKVIEEFLFLIFDES